MTRRWLVPGLLLALGVGSSARAGDVEQAVLAAQDKRIALTVAADLAGLGAAMTDDLTWTHSNANVETKAEFLEAIRSGKYVYKSMTFDDRRVRLHGDATAIVSGTCRVQVTSSGRDLDIRLRFTELYVKQAAGWKMALWQSTRVPD
jgi:ketosteroid isomerase-like protein